MSETKSMEKGFVRFFSAKAGLKIVRKGKFLGKVEGQLKKTPGKYIKFVNGYFRTKDKEEIEFLKEYSKKWPSDRITLVDETNLVRESEIRKRVIEEMEAEEKKIQAENKRRVQQSTKHTDGAEVSKTKERVKEAIKKKQIEEKALKDKLKEITK